jgi:peroxiredoxin
MKKYLCIALVVGFAACKEQEPGGKKLAVDGTVKNTNAKMIYLEENTPSGRPTIIDSSALKNDGSFSLQAKSREESLYQLRLQGKMVPFAFFINDAEKIRVNADLNNTVKPYSVDNSPATQALLNFDQASYQKGMQLFTEGSMVDSLQKAGAPDSVVRASYATVESTANELKAFAEDFIAKSNSPMLTLYALSAYQNTTSNLGIKGFSRTEMAAIINAAAQKFPSHTALQNIRKNLPSNKAQDFTQPDVNGNPVSLSQFRGKYVLVDFWASWCQPCRQDNPNVVKAFHAFKDKNFTILGVSLDQNKDAWQKAIQQDGLAWTQVSDLKFWDNAAAVLYGVQGIPYNVLVDPNGNIIAENLHGEEIIQTLQKVIK